MTLDTCSAESMGAPAPQNQAQRLAALRSYGILDTPREDQFDDIVKLAAYICRTPIAVINLIDEGRQWFKAEVGLGVRETPLDTSICAHAILRPGLFVVPDLSADDRFRHNPLVAGEPALRFYAGALLQSPDGIALGTVCVLDTTPREISDEQKSMLQSLARQVMIQMELRRTLAIAARANKYRSRLMAVAGHDLKQPLQVVSMVVSALQYKSTDAEEKSRMQMVLDTVGRMGPDLDRLAWASQLGDESDAPRLEHFALQDVFQSIKSTWSEHAIHKGIRLRVVRTSAMVFSDRSMLATIIGNLVGNAIKYTRRGGVLVGCRRLADRLCIQVLDSGIGIDPQRLQTVFDAFHQEDVRSQGLGLGLSIVQRTADALHCRITVRSEPGKGSIFSMDLPRTASPGP
jgi:signal transduction histidine kinase